MKYIFITILFGLLALFFYQGANASQKAECIKWQSQADQGYVDYYFTDWQIDQCNAHNISLEI